MKCTVFLSMQVICCLLFSQIPAAADDRVLVEVKNGAEVYESAWEMHSEHQYKGVSVLEQPVEVIAAVLADIDSYPDLQRMTPHKTRTTFINRTAGSGSMAPFIADLGSRATVVESLINMRTVAADPRYEKMAKELKTAIN